MSPTAHSHPQARPPPAAPPAPPAPDVPCCNCGRSGTFPGQTMILDRCGNTFCSPDCGWSFLLRPLEASRIAKAHAAGVAVARKRARRAKPASAQPGRPSSRRPPRLPREDDALCSGNAMFEYSTMMFGMEESD